MDMLFISPTLRARLAFVCNYSHIAGPGRLSFVLHKLADLWVALSLLGVNAILSFLQEQRASAAVAALRRRMRVTARVRRDGAWQAIVARELVRGDLVRIRSGDFVPADLRLCNREICGEQESHDCERYAKERCEPRHRQLRNVLGRKRAHVRMVIPKGAQDARRAEGNESDAQCAGRPVKAFAFCCGCARGGDQLQEQAETRDHKPQRHQSEP